MMGGGWTVDASKIIKHIDRLQNFAVTFGGRSQINQCEGFN